MAIQRIRRGTRLVLLGAIVALAGACAGPSPLGQMFSPDVYTVRAGDTLYAIAWRYERDVADLIRWNNLDDPDRLRPGQRIRLSPPSSASRQVAGGGEVSGGEAQRRTETSRASRSADAQQTTASDPAPSTDHSAGDGVTSAPVDTVDSGDWRWPAEGELVGTFGNGRVYGRGIDIAGREGQAVHAAAAGRVVYSGEGLQAYGPLIIIRHSSAYLSAYAHNRRLLVSEGDSVQAGDRIAEMGLAPGDEALLHFEIRRDGTPVDPLKYLPGRN